MENKENTSTIKDSQSMSDSSNGKAEFANGRPSIVNPSNSLGKSRQSLIRGHHYHRRRRLGKQVFSKEVLYPVLFALAIGAVLVWRLITGL